MISQFPTYKGLESAKPGNMKVAEEMTKKVLCLPIYTELREDTLGFIIESVIKYAK